MIREDSQIPTIDDVDEVSDGKFDGQELPEIRTVSLLVWG